MKEIIFTKTLNIPDLYPPTPASKNMPEWYKNLDSYGGFGKILDETNLPRTTAKKCMPLFDSMSAGYLIYSHADIFVSQRVEKNGELAPYYSWRQGPGVSFHEARQVLDYPNNVDNKFDYPKFINPWSIKTKKGYSCLFINPLHRDSVFTILPGMVDTDKYTAPVNLPFMLNDIKYEGLIPAGTPIAQIIPFKRDNWKMSFGKNKEVLESENVQKIIDSQYFDVYKRFFRSLKQYK